MEFTIEKKKLLSLIEKVSPILNSDKMLKANSLIEFSIFTNGLLLSTFSTDSNVKAFYGFETGVNLPTFGVEGQVLIELLRALPDSPVKFSFKDENVVKISVGKKSSKMLITPGDVFPLAPNYDNYEFFPAPGLFEKIDKVSFAASHNANDVRENLKCVCIGENDVVATNGFRMAVIPHGLNMQGMKFLLPIFTVTKLFKVFKETEKDQLSVSIDGDGSFMHFKLGDCVCSVRTIAKDYVQYWKIIPTSPYDEAKINRIALLETLALTSVMANQMKGVNMDFSDSRLKVYNHKQDLGDIEDELEIEFSAVKSITLNSSYLEDVLKRLSGDTINLEIRGELNPLVIRDGEYVNVIMPQKRNG